MITTEGTEMLARQKWQVKTIAVLEKIFEEREAQYAKHGDAMLHLPDGVGPNGQWLAGVLEEHTDPQTLPPFTNADIQLLFRDDYEARRAEPDNPMDLSESGGFGQLTRMHLVREEIAEAFECDPDSPEFIAELVQVTALCVQWLEYKLP